MGFGRAAEQSAAFAVYSAQLSANCFVSLECVAEPRVAM
jgi:hypothetical protein